MNQTEKLVEALEKIANGAHPYNEREAYIWIEVARNIAQQALESYKDGWVSVEERLPDATSLEHQDSEWVLCIEQIDGKFPQPAFVAWYNYKLNQFTVAHHYANSNAARVTHWQPLPIPPQTKTI